MRYFSKKYLALFLISFLAFQLTACSKLNESETISESSKAFVWKNPLDVHHVKIGFAYDIHLMDRLLNVHAGGEMGLDLENSWYNPLTGQYFNLEDEHFRPIAVQFDNHPGARPQAGLIDADIAFEFYVEGGMTRYLGIFLSSYPEHLGPIRSSRPYFIQTAMGFDAFYAHVGGSYQALEDIKAYGVPSINAMNSNAFWREGHKKIPHNLYTSSENILKVAESRGFRLDSDVLWQPFHMEPEEGNGTINAREIEFVYKAPASNQAGGYATSYKYHSEEKVYYRYTNGMAHRDEVTNNHLNCSNILVQYVPTRVLDQEGRLEMALIGEGEGMYYTDGYGIPVTWKKASYGAPTFFYYQGEKLVMNPGKTWVQVMRSGQKENIK